MAALGYLLCPPCTYQALSLGPAMSFNMQLWTTKANQLIISGTRIFDENLMTDLKPDRQKELKNGVFMLFPCFWPRQIFEQHFWSILHLQMASDG